MRLKGFIFQNLGVKIASLVFAIILWLFVISRGRTEVSYEAPLEFRNIPQGFELVGETTKSIDVWVEGHKSTLRRLKVNEVKTTIDLSDAKEGESIYYIGPEEVNVPVNLRVVRVNPTSIKVRIDKVVAKNIEVRPTIVGKPAPGFRLSKIEIHPPSLMVEGAKREIETLRFLKTEPIDITGVHKSFTHDGKIDTSGKNIRVQDKGDLEVKVFIAREER